MNKPQEISMEEWEEIVHVPELRRDWNLDETDAVEDVAEALCGVKFTWGWDDDAQDLYILHGDIAGKTTTLLRNDDGELELVDPDAE